MVLLRGSDQLRVDIDAHDLVAAPCERRTDPPRTASGIEDAGRVRRHRVDEAGLAVQVVTGCRHRTEPLDVPALVVRVSPGQLDPFAGRNADLLIVHAVLRIRDRQYTSAGRAWTPADWRRSDEMTAPTHQKAGRQCRSDADGLR